MSNHKSPQASLTQVELTLLLTPATLRKWADEMETKHKHALPGDSTRVAIVKTHGISISICYDQENMDRKPF